jgi:outer membrane protein assembly factor BamB
MKLPRVLPGRLCPLLTLCVLCVFARTSIADNWAHWRGPEQAGFSRDRDLPSKFSTDPADPEGNLIWKAPYGGRSTPIVMNGRVYLNNQAGEGIHEQERVMCLDASTGKKLWEKRFNVFHTDIVSLRLGWTNLCGDPDTGNVYWHGTQGDFVCFDKDGNILWQRQLTEQDGRISGYGGRLTSPVVDGELVIMGMLNTGWGDQAIGGNRFVAMNKRNGQVVWWSNPAGKPRDTYASTPVVVVINGQRLVISGGGDGGIHAMNVYTGKPVWSYPFSVGGVNAAPVVEGTRVYVCNATENPDNNVQGRVACLDAGEVVDGRPKMLWKVDGIKVRYTSPIIHEGRLYVCDDLAHLHCFDSKTGKPLWRRPFTYGRNAKSAPVLADGKIYVGDVNGKFHILEPGPKSCKRLYEHFFQSPDGTSDVEVSGNPAVANGRVYFLTQYECYCIGKKDHTAKPDPIPPGPKEEAVGEPAGVQVVPADVTLQPGDKADLWVHVLDKYGRELPRATADGTWSLPVPPLPPKAKSKVPPPALKGKIEANLAKETAGKGDGGTEVLLGSWRGATVTASRDVPAQQGYVVFDAGKLGKATVRVRVAPRLPYAQNFDKLPDGVAPGGWVNAQNKTFVTTLKDGNKVLRRNNAIASPLVARGNCYIGLPTMTDYTIEADVMGTQIKTGEESHMPDVGIGANRYTLALWGNLQRLRLTSWDAIPRVDQPVEYAWKPGVWYRLKLTVEVQGDRAVCRGKVWPRGEKEPADWTVEVTDPTPNREGCPTLYGYVTGHLGDQPGNNVYHDNVRIYPNRKGEPK